MHLLTGAVLVLACGYLDRLRGSSRWERRHPWANNLAGALYGGALAWLLGVDDPRLALAFAGLFVVGEWPGWGAVFGACLHGRPMAAAGLHRWQRGVFRVLPWAAATLRGALWGLPLWLLCWWHPPVLLVSLAMAVAFPLSLAIGRHWLDRTTQWHWPLPPTDKWLWDKVEALRGWLLAALLVLLAY